MPRWLQITLHALAIGAQAGLAFSGNLNPYATLGLAVGQAFLGGLAQSYNTDGTPQSVAMLPAAKPNAPTQ